MKICPFCAEEIQSAAIKCKHCGEFLSGTRPTAASEPQPPWYLRTTFIVLALGTLGPLALPLVWLRPQTSLAWKIGISVGILVLSWFLYLGTMQALQSMQEYVELLNGL